MSKIATGIVHESELQLPARDTAATRVAEHLTTARQLEEAVRRFVDTTHREPPTAIPLPLELTHGSLEERYLAIEARRGAQAARLEELNRGYSELRAVSFRSTSSSSIDSVERYQETLERARMFPVLAMDFLAQRELCLSIIEEYNRGLLESIGCADRSALRERIEDLSHAIADRRERFLGLGRFLYRSDVEELEKNLNTARSIDEVTGKKLVADQFSISFQPSNLDDLSAAVESRFQCVVEDCVRSQRYAIPEALQEREPDTIPTGIVTALRGAEIDRIAPTIAVRGQLAFVGHEPKPDEAEVSAIRHILSEGLQLSFEGRFLRPNDHDGAAVDSLREKIQGLRADLRYPVERALQEDIPYRERSWEATWRWLKEHPIIADVRAIDQAHHRIGTSLGALPHATADDRGDFARALQINMQVRPDSSARHGDFVSGHDPRLVEALMANPLVRNHLGDEFIQSAEAVLQGELLERFQRLSSLEKEERIEIGYRMMHRPSVEAAPFVLLNAFREPGHSGECPFRGHCDGENDITTYLSKLDAADRAKLEAMELPGFCAALALIERYPATYSHHHVTNEAGEWVVNPNYRELQGHLLELTEHFLRTGEPRTRQLAAWVMRGIDSPFTDQMRQTVVQSIVASGESGLDAMCLQGALERIRLHRDVGSATVVLDSIAARPELREAISAEQGYEIIRTMTAGELAAGDCEAIGEIIERSGEEVALVHRFIRELRRNVHFETYFESQGGDLGESFSSYGDAARTPGADQALAALGAYGYVFRREHLGVLPALIAAHEGILEDIARIRRYNPDYMYEPVRFRNHADGIDRFSIDPYAGLLMRHGPESQIELLQRAYAERSGVDPLLVRAAYGAWRSRDTEGSVIFGAVEEVPSFFSDALEEVVRGAGSVEEETLTPRGALIAHPMGQRLLSRSAAWAETLLEVADDLSVDSGRAPEVARDRLYLILDTLREVDIRAFEPPAGFGAWCRFVGRVGDGVAEGQLYNQVGRESLNNGLLRKELVEVLSRQHRFLGDPDILHRVIGIVGADGEGFAGVFPAMVEMRSLELDEKSFLRLMETVRDSAIRLGSTRESVFRGALPVLRINGWLSSVDDLVVVLPKLEGIAAQGLAGVDTWKTLAALYASRESNPLLCRSDIGAPTRELEIFTEYIKTHGNIPLPLLYGAFHRCMEERPFTEWESDTYRLRNTGKSGLAELRERSTQVRRNLLSSDGPIDTTAALELEMIAAQSRFSSSEWGRSDQTLEGRIENFNAAWQRGDIKPLSAAFAAASGETFRVKRIDDRALERFQYAEDALHKLEQLRHDVVMVHGHSLEVVFRRERATLGEAINERITDLSRPLSDDERRKDTSGRRAAARVEEAMRWVSFGEHVGAVNNLVGLVKAVAAFEKKDDPVTTPVLRRCLARLGMEQIGGADSLRAAAEAATDRGTIAKFVEFFGGIIRSDVMRDLELTDHQTKRAGSAVQVKALTAELERIEGLATAGTEVIGLRPTRGILAELSGFVCDACWTREDDIVSRYPNLTTVVFVKNPGSANERLCGATVVLKVRSEATESSPAEDVLVVRGFNPLQNTITQLKADQFFEGFIGWLEGVARAEGVSKIVIPGGVAGGSQTNRPTIHTYVSGRYGRTPIVPLSSEVRSTFNGYDISRSCHLVRSTDSSNEQQGAIPTDTTTPLQG